MLSYVVCHSVVLSCVPLVFLLVFFGVIFSFFFFSLSLSILLPSSLAQASAANMKERDERLASWTMNNLSDRHAELFS